MSVLPERMAAKTDAAHAGCLTAEAFAEAFTANSRVLWCIAAGVLGGRDNVEDVLQDGAVIALGKLDQFDPNTSFVAWMGRIVRYVAMNHGRRRQRARASSADPAALENVPAEPDRTAGATTAAGKLPPDQRFFDDQVLAALKGLEEVARSCLLLRTLMEMPYRDISRALDIPEGTAMSHVHRARRHLRQKLRDRAPQAAGAEDGMR
jgi:RNA polymerase sigma-70 factor (ECF subfamily)